NGWQAEQISTWISRLVERVTKVLPHEHFTVEITYSGWIPCFIGMSFPFACGRPCSDPTSAPPPSISRVREAVVLHEPLHIAVERQVIAPEFLPLPLLLHRDHVERGAGGVSLILHPDRRPPLADGLLELGHHRVVAPACQPD